MSSYQSRDSHYKNKAVSGPSYLFNGNLHNWKDHLYIETELCYLHAVINLGCVLHGHPYPYPKTWNQVSLKHPLAAVSLFHVEVLHSSTPQLHFDVPYALHDDVIILKQFLDYWLFLREIHWSLVDFLPMGPVMWSFYVFLVTLAKMFNRQLSCQLFEMA